MPLEYYDKFKSHPEGRWVMSREDCERLQELVKKHDRRTILDLGSGIGASTYALAEATEGKVWAVEQFEKCQKVAKELIPVELLPKIEFLRVDPGIVKVDGIPFQNFSAFRELPVQNWDLIIVDGPGPFLYHCEVAKLPNGDIFGVMPSLKAGTLIYVDARWTAVILMRRYLFPYLRLINELTDERRGFTLLERNDVPWVGIADMELSFLKANGYFK